MKRVKLYAVPLSFVLVFGMLFNYVTNVFELKQLEEPWNMSNKILGVSNEPQSTIDVMYFGSSHMYTSINPVIVWQEKGIPSYVMASQKQPLWISYYYMKEALKGQKPKVVVLDIYMSNLMEEYADEGVNRPAIDILDVSLNKINMINASVKPEERWSYYINLIKYHGRWNELTEQDFDLSFRRKKDPLKGYVCLCKATPIKEKDNLEGVTKKAELSKKTLKYLDKIIALSKEKQFDLVLYKAPSHATVEEKEFYNTVQAIAKEKGIHFIDYNMRYEALSLDSEKDFYDINHVNIVGASKVSKDFANYLSREFGLKDKRKDEGYEAWEDSIKVYSRWEKSYALKSIKLADAYLSQLQDENYKVLFTSISSSSLESASKESKALLKQYGIIKDEKVTGDYIAHMESGELATPIAAEQLNEELKEKGWPLKVTLDETGRYTLGSIKSEKADYVKHSGGISIIVYDKVLNRIVSNVVLDLRKSGEVVQ